MPHRATDEQDDTLRDAIALARAMLTGDRPGAAAIIGNTRSQADLARAAEWLAILSWAWPETPTAADQAEMDSELARFQQQAAAMLRDEE